MYCVRSVKTRCCRVFRSRNWPLPVTPACARGKHLVVMAPPSFAARSTAEAVAPYLEQDAVLVSVTKGIERGTSLRMSQILEEVTGRTVAGAVGTVPCRRGRTQYPDRLCGGLSGSQDSTDGAGCVYERAIPGLLQP